MTDGFQLLLEAAHKKKKKGPSHPRIGFPGYGFSSVPGDRAQTDKFCPSISDSGNIVMPAPTPIHTQGQDGGGVIVMTPGNGDGGDGGPVMAAPTAGDGGGAAAGESVEMNKINSIIESYKTANPNSPVIEEIQSMLKSVNEGNGYLYHSCDGATAITPNELPPVAEFQVSALAAACESTLSAFKKYTGFDYLSWRNN